MLVQFDPLGKCKLTFTLTSLVNVLIRMGCSFSWIFSCSLAAEYRLLRLEIETRQSMKWRCVREVPLTTTIWHLKTEKPLVTGSFPSDLETFADKILRQRWIKFCVCYGISVKTGGKDLPNETYTNRNYKTASFAKFLLAKHTCDCCCFFPSFVPASEVC